MKGKAIFDPELPEEAKAYNFGAEVKHVYHVPSPVTQCCLASFHSGHLQIYRLHPVIEKMEGWTPPEGTPLDILIGPQDESQNYSVVCLTLSDRILHVWVLHFDPRRLWLRLAGSISVSHKTAFVMRTSCNFQCKCLAVLYSDGSLTMYPLPTQKDATVDSRTLLAFDPTLDVQLLKPPDDHCCCLNFYTSGYIFVLAFSQKENAAVACVYDLHLNALHSKQILQASSSWAHSSVTASLEGDTMLIGVNSQGKAKRISLPVPVVTSNLLDALTNPLEMADKVEQQVTVMDLTNALAALNESPTFDAEEACKFIRTHAQTPTTNADLLSQVRQLCKSKKFDKVKPLVSKDPTLCIVESDVPGLLSALMARKDSQRSQADIEWYYLTVQRIKGASLTAGLQYIAKRFPSCNSLAEAVILATTKYEYLAEVSIALEQQESIILLRYIYQQMVSLLQSQQSTFTTGKAGILIHSLLSLATSLIDAHITDLIAADTEVQALVVALYRLCKSYTKYVRDLWQLEGFLSCVAGDPTSLTRSLVSKDISPGLLRAPELVKGGYTYHKFQPRHPDPVRTKAFKADKVDRKPPRWKKRALGDTQ